MALPRYNPWRDGSHGIGSLIAANSGMTQPRPVPTPAPPAPKPTDAWDTAYETAKTNADHDRTSNLARITYDEGRSGRDYGFKFGYGADGFVDMNSIAVDTSDPFSKMSLLQKAYEDTKRSSANSYAAQGQLYAGSYANQQNSDAFGYSQGSDSLTKAFTDSIKGSGFNRVQTQSDYDTTVSNAGYAKLAALLQAGA